MEKDEEEQEQEPEQPGAEPEPPVSEEEPAPEEEPSASGEDTEPPAAEEERSEEASDAAEEEPAEEVSGTAEGEPESTPPALRLDPSDRRFRLVLNVLCALGFGCLLTLSAMLLNVEGARAVWPLLRSSTAAVLLTIFFFALAGLALGLALGRLVRGLLIVYVPVIVLLTVNYFKEKITTTPLELADLKLAGQAGDIAGLNAQALNVSGSLLLALLLPLAGCTIVRVFCKKYLDLDWKWSLSSAGGSLAAFLVLFVLLADAAVYTPLNVPLTEGMSQAMVNVRTLVPLGLWRGALYQLAAALGLNMGSTDAESSIWELIDVPEEPASSVQPNVIFILSESFFDVTSLPGVTFEEDPLADYHALLAESVSGTFYTRTLGYGTCAIELEVFTGMNDRLLQYGDDLIYHEPEQLAVFPTLPALFRDSGYHTTYFHNYYDTIYNRQELFSQLGFDEMYFIYDIPDIDPACVPDTNYWPYLDTKRSGYDYYYSDQYLSELLIHLYERKEEGVPQFLYGISIENHSPYTGDKYDHYDYPFTCEAELTEDALDALSAYVQGVSNTSESLRMLTDYFSQVEEPVILVFYGDHRPGLGLEDGSSVYSQLGIYTPPLAAADPEVLAGLFCTDYLIWANDPELLPGPAGGTADTSSNFLGLEVLKAAGIELPRYWRLVDSLSQEYLTYNWFYFLGPDGTASSAMPDTAAAKAVAAMSYAMYDAFHDQERTQWLNLLPGTPEEEPEEDAGPDEVPPEAAS